MSVITAPEALVSCEPAILDNIVRDDCNLAIWQRKLTQSFAAMVTDDVANIRFECTAQEVAEKLETLLGSYGFAAPHLHAALANDVAMLANRFGAALGLARLEVRLERVIGDSCRKFHGDYVTARLITTYAGPGTEWLDARDAQALSSGQAPSRIHRMDTGDVGLFKGKLATPWPAIHRSPPISGTGDVRLLLVLNPVTAGSHEGFTA